MLGGKLARAERDGVIPHGWRCYGWRTVWLSEGGKPVHSIELDQAQATVAREALTRIAAGEPKQQIADDLDRRGILTLDSKRWTIQRLWYMARNRAYVGEVVMHLKHAQRDFTFQVPPIIDEATWQAANAQLKRKPRLSLDVHPLNGLLSCAACGGAMSGTNKVQAGRTYSHYRCTRAWKHAHYGPVRCDHTTHHRAAERHDAAESAVRHQAGHPGDYLGQPVQAAPDTGRQKAAKEVARLEALLARYRADYTRNLLDGKEYAQMRDEARGQLAVVQAEAALIQMPVLRDARESLDLIHALVGQGLGWREVLHRSSTTLHLAPGGQLEVKLRV